ncbi:4Fe-4S dicluster domain-containing protein [Pinisolibacter sp.]|uniref:4Fe-4S dicluster domain-containing protein n=1 Tax=Pinisolibacter sp. TaxID=2172024 RepID=UPI002FDCFB83
MLKWNMIVDVEKCMNCHNCFLATKDEYVGNDFPGYSAPQPLHGHKWLHLVQHQRGQAPMVESHSMPVMCNQCANAPCIKAARDGAVYERPDGIVVIDPVKAKGQKQIVQSCPYGAIDWNEELQLPQKWCFDAHLLDDGWTRTRAEQACPTGALRSIRVADDEMRAIATRDGLEGLRPELGTRPRVHYRNLQLMRSVFVGGTVVSRADGLEDCFAGVTARLSKNGAVVAETTTDTFGEFKFDRLERGSGAHDLELDAGGARRSRHPIVVDDSRYLGIFAL